VAPERLILHFDLNLKILEMKYRIMMLVAMIFLVSFSPNSALPGMRVECMPVMEIKKTGSEPWTTKQLMAPADLAELINNPAAKKPVIICVGPGALIKGSIDTGPAKEKENLEKLKKELTGLSKDAEIVIYCGCCPFDHCPNIRPAFSLLNEMKFTNTHLLNIEHNLRTDWVNKGYPQEKA